jgi:hypothetical protein
MSDPKLPDGKEWAVAPLLDKSNVGKYVWVGLHNTRPIVSVGRTNIHVGYVRPDSLRVSNDGETARGMSGGYQRQCETNAHREQQCRRNELLSVIRKAYFGWLTTAQLEQIVAILKAA